MQTISTTDLAHRLRPVIARLARRMRQHAGGDMSPTQAAALNTISCHGPLTPSELAAREKIQRPTATRERKDMYLAMRLDRLSPEELAVLERAAGILERVLEEGAE